MTAHHGRKLNASRSTWHPPPFALPIRLAVGALTSPVEPLQCGRDASLVCSTDTFVRDAQGVAGDFADSHSVFYLEVSCYDLFPAISLITLGLFRHDMLLLKI